MMTRSDRAEKLSVRFFGILRNSSRPSRTERIQKAFEELGGRQNGL